MIQSQSRSCTVPIWPPTRDAGIVADDMHLAEGGDGFERRGAQAARSPTSQCTGTALICSEASRSAAAFAGVVVDIGDHDIHACPAESARHGKADAARAAGDERGLALKILHYAASFIFERIELRDERLALWALAQTGNDVVARLIAREIGLSDGVPFDHLLPDGIDDGRAPGTCLPSMVLMVRLRNSRDHGGAGSRHGSPHRCECG